MSKKRRVLQKKIAVLQRQIKDANIPVLILLEGWENSGKGSMINSIIREMDPRSFAVKVFERETEEEKRRPFLWRFWRDIPPRGHFHLFDRSHYLHMMNPTSLDRPLAMQTIQDIHSFEQQLTSDGTLLIKFFLTVSKQEQKRRIFKLEESPYSSFRISEADYDQQKNYEHYEKLFKSILQKTDFDFAPWHVIDSDEGEEAIVKGLSILVDQLEGRIQKTAVAFHFPPLPRSNHTETSIYHELLEQVDLSKKLDKIEYKKKLKALQNETQKLTYQLYMRKIPVVLAFEGWDAAGKGGSIKRLTQKIDPRGYEVIPIAAPDQTEKQYHYMWRFYKHLPKTGHIRIFDRSWYGRVMVERIEGFATCEEWQRAFDEINQNEAHITRCGTLLLKFFLHIDSDEQLRRFQQRKDTPEKSHKLTDEDWRNREKWASYQEAIGEMIHRTNTSYAPWILVEANDKYHARIKVLSAFISSVKEFLEMD